MRTQIATYKRYGALIQTGAYFRLTNPFTEEVGAWQFLSKDQSELLVNAVMLEIHGNMPVNYLRLKGLPKGCLYQEESSKAVYASDALMEAGLPLPVEMGEYQSYQFHFTKVS